MIYYLNVILRHARGFALKKPLYYETTARVAFQHNHLCTKFFHLATLQSESYLIIANSYH